MADTLQYKIIPGGLLPPVPSLPQSQTPFIRGTSNQTYDSDNYSDKESIFIHADNEHEHESDSDASSNSSRSSVSYHSDTDSFSSDWDTRTIISTVSTVLPPKQKTIEKTDIKRYLTQQFLIEFKKDPQIDITYDLYQLFYPYTNLQSLLFSQIQPYIESDYSTIKNKNKNIHQLLNHHTDIETPKHNVKMDWKDIYSVNRIKGLITKLLSSSSSNQGIKEDQIYLMFSSPDPAQIIQQLRFGVLSVLCDVHMDRFGRRSYHYQQCTVNRNGHRRRESQLHFYNHSQCPSSMFGENDIIGLSDFIEEDSKSHEISRANNQNNKSYDRNPLTVAKIHYHDNDVVMVTSSKNGQMETEIQWQNYAIHSYLYEKTHLSPKVLTNKKKNLKKQKPIKRKQSPFTFSSHLNLNFINTRARSIGQYGQKIPYVFKLRKSPSYNPPKLPKKNKKKMKIIKNIKNMKNIKVKNKSININIGKIKMKKKKKKEKNKVRNERIQITKEGYLEKESFRSIAIANIMNKQWIPYWCVLWSTQLLLYKNNRDIKDMKQGILYKNKAIECINLSNISIPISTSFDMVNKYYTFRLDKVNQKQNENQCFIFRTKSEYERNHWLTNIDSMLDYEHNIAQTGNNTKDTNNDKAANCLIM